MMHYIEIGNLKYTVSIDCRHEDLKDNCCPLDGDCATCKYCEVSMSAIDYFKIQDVLRKRCKKED